jgi:selenide,water dikinase
MIENNLKSIVLVGGGHTHALVLNALKTRPLSGAQVTVINPSKTAPYSGMLPGFVAGHYTREELDIDLDSLSNKVGATLIKGRAIAMDPVKKEIHLEDGGVLTYDFASVDVGITSQMDALIGFSEHGIPAKPLDNFSQKWDAFRGSEGPKHVVIIGGGIAGAELSMAMAFALRDDKNPVSVQLLDRSKILSANSPQTQKRVRKELPASNVTIREGVDVVEVTENGVTLADGSTIEANFVVGAAGATPHGWIKDTGLALTDGFIDVSSTLETNGAGVFAVGDCAHMKFDPRPKAGVYAVRQAPILTENLRRVISGKDLAEYVPQSDYLKLVSLGGKRAFGEKKGWGFAGHLTWLLKNRIDRQFMDQF